MSKDDGTEVISGQQNGPDVIATPPNPPPAGAYAGRPPSAGQNNRPADDSNNAHRTQQEKTNVQNNYITLNNGGVVRSLSFNDGWLIGDKNEEEIARLFVIAPDEIEAMWEVLTEKRLLVIAGEPETGKATAAIYLGTKLADFDNPQVSDKTCIISELGRQVRVDLRKLSDDDGKIFSKRLVIFEDALAHKNADLIGFFKRLKHGAADLTERLRRKDSFLIFTVRTSELKEFQHALVEHKLYYKLSEPRTDLLNTGLDKRLEFLAGKMRLAEVRMQAIEEQRDFLLSKVKTMPLLARFLEYYFSEMIAEEVPVALEEAIQRFKDVSYWFVKNLSKDFEAWCFALSLCLGHPAQDARGVSWTVFERLWRMMSTYLKRDQVLFSQLSKAEAARQEESEDRLSMGIPDLSETVYLEKCRAEIFKDSTSLSDMIRFRDPRYTTDLWKALLSSHRRVLSAIFPQFRKIVETNMEFQDWEWRALAAQIIGRIGELDPENITLATIARWVQADDRRLRASVGYLYKGILSSPDQRYKNLCLTELEALTAAVGDDDTVRDQLMTAIAAYRQVGVYDLPLAMRELRRIAMLRLEPTLRDTQRIERLLEKVEQKFDQPLYVDEAIKLLATHAMLYDWAGRLYANEGGIFWSIQFAIVSLCQDKDPVSVFQELREWIASSYTMGVLVALMFLQETGIASQLEVNKIVIPAPEDKQKAASPGSASAVDGISEDKNAAVKEGEKIGEKNFAAGLDASNSNSLITKDNLFLLYNRQATQTVSRSNPIVLSLAAGLATGNDAVKQMARFLAAIYESVSTRFSLPGRSQRYFRISFLQHLKTWVLDSIQVESCRLAMEDLLVELMQIRGGDLYELIFQLLNDKDFARQDSELKAFADAVLRRG
jgi:hypothetical protein